MLRTTVRVLAGFAAGALLILADGGTALLFKLRRMARPLPPVAAAEPAPRAVDPALPLAVVLASHRGTEVTDFLPPYQMLAASGAFTVLVVAPERAPATLHSSMLHPAGLGVVPDYSFSEYQEAVGRAPDLIVIPYLPGFTPEADAATLAWIRQHAGPGTRLLTICAGVEILAATGLLDGHAATGNVGWLDRFRTEYPAVRWQEHQRFVEDGQAISSARLNAGIDATLAMIARIAGREAAHVAARATGYQRLEFLDAPAHVDADPDLRPVVQALLLNRRLAEVGVLLAPGVDEAALAATLEFAGSTLTRSYTVSRDDQPVRSRFGLTLLPTITEVAAAGLDAVEEVPGGPGYGYDAVVRQRAAAVGGLRALAMARNVNYPAEHLALEVSRWDWSWWRLLLEMLLGMGLVLAVGAWRRQAVAVAT